MTKKELYVSRRAPYGTWKCKFCNEIFESKKKLYNHLHLEHTTEFKSRNKKEHFCKYCGESLGYNKRKGWDIHKNKCKVYSQLLTKKGGHLHSEKTKEYLSQIRKQYLLDNPEKHPWKNKDKFLSKPCEYFKQLLKENGFFFIEEYMPLESHNYSIDIAFPNEKIGIEINGNQHYKDLTTNELADYYKERHNLIEADGWKLLEIHYYNVYLEEEIKKIINLLKQQLSNNTENLIKNYQDRCHSFISILKQQEKEEKRKNYEESRKKFIEERKRIIDSIDTSKYGWVEEASKKLGISHSSVRRWVEKFYPELNAYKRN